VKWSDKIECSEIKTSISSTCQMSSSSQSATRRSSSSSSSSSSSYTYGIPGSQVTIILNKSGNHSLALSRGSNPNSKTSSSIPAPVGQPFCKVCYDAGLPVANYTGHFVKDQPGPGGKVVCPTLLAQKCLKCGVAGHTSSYCPQEARLEAERKERARDARRMNEPANGNGWKVVGGAASIPVPLTSSSKPQIKTAAPPPVARGSFGLLAVDEPSDDSEYEREQEEVRNTPAGVPKPVVKERPVLTGPPPAIEPAKPLTWAQRAAAAATKTPSSSSSSTSSAPVQTSPLVDTRFQLHSLCDRVEMSKRASSAKKVAAASAANHRGNAASIARESSLKRKQESVTIPA
jgi:hypothetical protein